MDIENQLRMCRICQEEEGDFLQNTCSCRGSLAYVHKECLLKWIASKRNNAMVCEICKTHFNIHRTYCEKVLEPLDTNEIILPIMFSCFFGFNFIISITCGIIFFASYLNVFFVWSTPIVYLFILVFIFNIVLNKLKWDKKISVVVICEAILSAPLVIVLFFLGVFLNDINFFYAMFSQFASLVLASIAFFVSKIW